MLWLMDQTKKVLVNTDHCALIYSEIKTGSIKARLNVPQTEDGKPATITLGVYPSKDICNAVLGYLLKRIMPCNNYWEMPMPDDKEMNYIIRHDDTT